MPRKNRSIIHVKKSLAGPYKIRIKIGSLVILVLASLIALPHSVDTSAISCPDLKIVFARGSGGNRYTSSHYLAFKTSLEQKLRTSNLTYQFEDLDYPAVSIGIGDGHLGTLLGAFIGSGDAYDFGDSVHQGTAKLLKMVNNDPCQNTKYVFAGYSQGNLVIMNELNKIDPHRVIYVATFGDPKIYLPEGAGPVPRACSGKNLSDYRIYVPDCRAYRGILGARDPYVISSFRGKIGTWCNKKDVLCSSYLSIRDHTHYDEDGVFEDASRYIFSRIAQAFGFSNQYTSPHDTAILINSASSLATNMPDFQSKAYRIAEKTLRAGGRVAIYDYHESKNGTIIPTERCNFETCATEDLKTLIGSITMDSSPQINNPLLSSSLHVMKQLNWRIGSTKSLVIFTDSAYRSPDLGGTSFYNVNKLSKQIDPVNFYIVTDQPNLSNYQSLADVTDGAVISADSDDEELPDLILSRFDSFPRVEEEFEDETYDTNLPILEINEIKSLDTTRVEVSYVNSGTKALVVLNDAILGVTDQETITITELHADIKNTLTLVPLTSERRGEPVSAIINTPTPNSQFPGDSYSFGTSSSASTWRPVIPKAPQTGMR